MRSHPLFEHDLRANALRSSRGKPVSTLGSSPRACFSGSCSRFSRQLAIGETKWNSGHMTLSGLLDTPLGSGSGGALQIVGQGAIGQGFSQMQPADLFRAVEKIG